MSAEKLLSRLIALAVLLAVAAIASIRWTQFAVVREFLDALR